jgi:hypothetical protein
MGCAETALGRLAMDNGLDNAHFEEVTQKGG